MLFYELPVLCGTPVPLLLEGLEICNSHLRDHFSKILLGLICWINGKGPNFLTHEKNKKVHFLK
jgi:hypothetical protein